MLGGLRFLFVVPRFPGDQENLEVRRDEELHGDILQTDLLAQDPHFVPLQVGDGPNNSIIRTYVKVNYKISVYYLIGVKNMKVNRILIIVIDLCIECTALVPNQNNYLRGNAALSGG